MDAISISVWREIRCPECNKLVAKISGLAILECSCSRCKKKFVWPSMQATVVVEQAKITGVIPVAGMVTAGTEIPPHV